MAGATPRGPIALAPAAAAVAPPVATARLVAIAKDGSEGSKFGLSGDQVDLGREEGTIILPEDPYISPRHLRFTRKDGRWHVRDLGSLNGAYLRIREPRPLVDSDLLLVGLQVLRFEAVNDAEQGLGPATQHGTLLFGSPILPRFARLCQRTVEGVTRNVFHLHREETVIGRESGDIVFTDDPFLSRRHLVIRRDASSGKCTVEDLASSNGTYLAIRGEVPIDDGAYLRVGQHLFRFDASGAAGAARRGS
jgi:pSer/pThr/pTyr-binding forkhead associated (FHA) protein